MLARAAFTLALASLSACASADDGGQAGNAAPAAQASAAQGANLPFQRQELARFDEPWAMTFLPNGAALITEKRGRLKLWRQGAPAVDVAGTPTVAYGGQGGLGDVVLHPNFAQNGMVYLSFAEPSGEASRGAVGRGRLVLDGGAPRIEGFQVIWRQTPDFPTRSGHYGHRLAFGPDGMLFIANGERQNFTPAQDMGSSLGKVVRLHDDGRVPADNPFAAQGGVAAQVWTLGHRNPLGLAFDAAGNLWEHEMGPANGDEFNLIERGKNYGYPVVSNGDHYDGRPIPDHDTRPDFQAPQITFNGVSPAGMMIYTGSLFPQWRNSAFMGGLSGQTLIRVALNGRTAREAERWNMGARVREVEQGPDGAIYVLIDTRRGSGGELLRLTPAGL